MLEDERVSEESSGDDGSGLAATVRPEAPPETKEASGIGIETGLAAERMALLAAGFPGAGFGVEIAGDGFAFTGSLEAKGLTPDTDGTATFVDANGADASGA